MASDTTVGHERIGIEIEFQILDQDTFELSDSVDAILEKTGPDENIGHESFQGCLEIKTSPSLNVSEAREEIIGKLRKVLQHLPSLGLRLCSLGIHPYNQRRSKTTNQQRYLAFEREYPFITHRHLIFSTHVHVGMSSLQESLNAMNEARYLLPLFLALSASSPFWEGERTGFVSFRNIMQKGGLNCGIPPLFQSEEEFYDFFQAAQKTGAANDLKDIHWDLRPRPDLGTLEVRIMDAVPSLEETMSLAALVHCTLHFLKTRSLNDLLPSVFKELPPLWAENLNYFQAAHLGIEAKYVINRQGNTVKLKDLASSLVDSLLPTARELDEEEEISRLKNMLESNLPFHHIEEVFEKTTSLKEVVRYATELLHQEIRSFPQH